MENILAAGTMPDGYNGHVANVVWEYNPETQFTKIVCRFGEFTSGLPQAPDKETANILLLCLAPPAWKFSHSL